MAVSIYHEKLDKTFTYQAPKPDQIPRYEQIRSMARHVAFNLVEHCPESHELSVALDRLSEVVMWANAAIARNE